MAPLVAVAGACATMGVNPHRRAGHGRTEAQPLCRLGDRANHAPHERALAVPGRSTDESDPRPWANSLGPCFSLGSFAPGVHQGIRAPRPPAVTRWTISMTMPMRNRIQEICEATAATPKRPR